MNTQPGVSVADYFTALASSEQKLDYHSGEIGAGAVAQSNRTKIHPNIFISLRQSLKDQACFLKGSNLLVKAGICGNYYLPVLVLDCQKHNAKPLRVDMVPW